LRDRPGLPHLYSAVMIDHLKGPHLTRIKPVFPVISVIAIVLIIAIIVAVNHDRMADISVMILIAVILHNLIGLVSGYGLTKLFGYDKKTCRTVAIEVGMQNSGLSVALAIKYFSPLAALPGAVFSIWHNISGSVLASWWVRRK